MSGEVPDAEDPLVRLMPSGSLAEALAQARELADSAASTGITVTRGLAADSGVVVSLALVRDYLAEDTEELSRRGSLIVADQAAVSLRLAREGYRQLVESANEGFEAGMDRLFLAAGFSRSAGRYQREGIIGSTVMSGVVREHQEVAGYTPFPVPGFEVGIDLSAEALAALSSEGIQARLSSALDEMEDQREEIFGPDDETQGESDARRRSFDKKDYTVDDDNGFWGELREGILALFGERESGTTHVEQSWGAGSFGAHIGYSPVFVGAPDPDKSYEENILEPGSGQLDHLIGWYSYWEMRVGKGLAELTAPVYDKPLWNDEGAVFEAPTLRAVVDFGVSVGALLTGNPWAIAAINLTDDALFGMMDLGAG